MNLGYLEFLKQWPLIIAALLTFFAIKSFLFKRKQLGKLFSTYSEEMVTNTIKDSVRDGERDLRNRILLEKARNISKTMYMLRGGAIERIRNKPNDLSLELNNWQKGAFGWALIWFGVTIFFIVENFLDPANWGDNWALFPYFIYYITVGVIYFFKR